MDEDTSDTGRWVRAFPQRLEIDVRLALNSIPRSHEVKPIGSSLSLVTTDSDRHPRGLWLDGEALEIPTRQYLDLPEVTRRVATTPTSVQDIIVSCIYSRHHDGYVRQQHCRSLVATRHRWVVPFVLQLVGEYVIDIVEEVLGILASTNDEVIETYAAVAEQNAGYLELVAARAASYWDCYHRRRYPRLADYPAMQVLDLLGVS